MKVWKNMHGRGVTIGRFTVALVWYFRFVWRWRMLRSVSVMQIGWLRFVHVPRRNNLIQKSRIPEWERPDDSYTRGA